MSDKTKTLQEQLSEAKKDSPIKGLNLKQIRTKIHNTQQKINGASLDAKEREKLSVRNTKNAEKGWQVSKEKRNERVKAVRDGVWGETVDPEARGKQGALISAGKMLNHPTKGRLTAKKVKQQISKKLKGKKRYCYPHYILHGSTKKFKSVKEEAKFYNVKPDTISKWINNTGMVKLEI